MSNGSLDLYALFGLPWNAPNDDINKTFRRLSLSMHPDKLLEADRAEGETKFKQLSAARDTLTDATQRSKYHVRWRKYEMNARNHQTQAREPAAEPQPREDPREKFRRKEKAREKAEREAEAEEKRRHRREAKSKARAEEKERSRREEEGEAEAEEKRRREREAKSKARADQKERRRREAAARFEEKQRRESDRERCEEEAYEIFLREEQIRINEQIR